MSGRENRSLFFFALPDSLDSKLKDSILGIRGIVWCGLYGDPPPLVSFGVENTGMNGLVLLDCDGLPEPSETWYEKLRCDVNGKCPKCGHKLPTHGELKDKMQIAVSGNPATMRLSPTVGAFGHDYHKRGTSP
jgi:hypothetical protein